MCNSLGERAFSRAASKLWSALPQDLHSSSSDDILKSKLKLFYIEISSFK